VTDKNRPESPPKNSCRTGNQSITYLTKRKTAYEKMVVESSVYRDVQLLLRLLV
jgi:hypothetical protein